MELSIATIIIVIVVVWYLGTSINAILAGSGDLASKEFTQFKRAQDIRIHKQRIKEYKTVDKFKDQPVYTDKQWDTIFAKDDEDE